MKKLAWALALLLLCCLPVTAWAESPAVRDGSYPVAVDSDSSLFRIVDCQLTVKEGRMAAVLTLNSTGYEKLYLGAAAQAAAAPESACIYSIEDGEGRCTFTMPVEALDQPLPCAAWSIEKGKWYDRTLVFRSDSLPSGATGSGWGWVWVILLAAAAGAGAALYYMRGRRPQKG